MKYPNFLFTNKYALMIYIKYFTITLLENFALYSHKKQVLHNVHL